MKRVARTLVLVGLAACREEPHPPPPMSSASPVASASTQVEAKLSGAEVSISTSSAEARKAYLEGRDDADNTRDAEAIEHFRKAIGFDSKLALAHAYIGFLLADAEGKKSMDRALELSPSLPEAERLSIEELAALRMGDNEKARVLAMRITELTPFDWHAQLNLGKRLFSDKRFDEAKQAFGKAAAFGPAAAVTYNSLGYLYLMQRQFEPAIVEFRKYATLRPDEPNTLDSLGEALLAVGKLDDAEDSFRKAATKNFSFAWGGVAEARFLRGDWPGGMEALAMSRKGAALPADRLDVDAMAVWALLAQHKTDDALARVESLEKEAKELKLDDSYAMAPAYRAAVLLDGGKAKEALDELDKAVQRVERAVSSGRAMMPVQRMVRTWRAILLARLNKAADAEKAASDLETLAQKAPAEEHSMAILGRGCAAAAKGDYKEAAAKLAECPPEDLLCRRELMLMQDKNGDAAGAAATAAELKKVNVRHPLYIYVRSRLPPK